MSPNIACGPVNVFTTPIFTVCAAALVARSDATVNAAMRLMAYSITGSTSADGYFALW